MEIVSNSSVDREGRWNPKKPQKIKTKTGMVEAALRPKATFSENLNEALDESFPASDPVSL